MGPSGARVVGVRGGRPRSACPAIQYGWDGRAEARMTVSPGTRSVVCGDVPAAPKHTRVVQTPTLPRHVYLFRTGRPSSGHRTSASPTDQRVCVPRYGRRSVAGQEQAQHRGPVQAPGTAEAGRPAW